MTTLLNIRFRKGGYLIFKKEGILFKIDEKHVKIEKYLNSKEAIVKVEPCAKVSSYE